MISFKLADIGEGIKEVEVLQWYVKPGDKVAQFDKVCSVQSDKATVDITSRYDGVVKELKWKVGEMAKVGESLAEFEVEGEQKNEDKLNVKKQIEPEPQKAPRNAPQITSPSSINSSKTQEQSKNEIKIPISNENSNSKLILTSPAVRRLAREHDIDLRTVPASGKDGRITKEDFLEFVEDRSKRTVNEKDKIVPIRGITRVMVKSMEESLKIPHFHFMEEYSVDQLQQFRNQLKQIAETNGVKISYMPLLIKATSLSLKSHPSLNAHYDHENIIYKDSHNIGVAMDTPKGLLVPVIKDCQLKSIFEIAKELGHLQERGKQNKLDANDLKENTFTLSNIGTIGGTYATPIIPAPTVCIGAIGRILTLPRYDHTLTNVIKSNCMNISWAADHRVIDGATIAKFSNQLKKYIEHPFSMIGEL